MRRRVQLAHRNDGVDQAPIEGLLGGVLTAEIEDFARALLADRPVQDLCRRPARHAAHLRPGLAELGVLCRDRNVANEMQLMTEADRIAVHGGNHRLRRLANGDREMRHDAQMVALHRARPVGDRLHVAARAKRLFPGAGENNRADLRVFRGVAERGGELLDRMLRDGIVGLRAIDGDRRDAVLLVVENIGERDFHVGIHRLAPEFRYFPWNFGLRFSRKAAMPSLRSSVRKS